MLSPSPKKSEGELARTFQMLLVASKILLTDAYDILFLAFAGVIASLLVYYKREAVRGRICSSSPALPSWFAYRLSQVVGLNTFEGLYVCRGRICWNLVILALNFSYCSEIFI